MHSGYAVTRVCQPATRLSGTLLSLLVATPCNTAWFVSSPSLQSAAFKPLASRLVLKASAAGEALPEGIRERADRFLHVHVVE